MQYWWATRPHRKLIRVPKSLSAFAGVASGNSWTGNKDAHIQYETKLEQLDLKKRGDHTERAFGRGGSGGRTHAQLLYSLGLFFYQKESIQSPEEVHLTLAGEALLNQEDALPILRKQVLAYQFPSAFSTSNSVNVDRRFKLRPFVMLLKLLRNEYLEGYLSDSELAACVIGEATRHSDKETEQIVERVLRFRHEGVYSLDADFPERMKPRRARKSKPAQELISSSLGDVANTFSQWLRYTGYAIVAPGEEFGSKARSVTAINSALQEQIDESILEWESKTLITLLEPEDDSFASFEAAKAFQRTYGVKVGGQKDQRTIREIRTRSETERTLGLVSSSLSHLFATQVVTSPSAEIVEAIVQHSGMDHVSVAKALETLVPTPKDGIHAFLDRLEQMAFSGQEEAISFERANAEVMTRIFGLGAAHIGQQGTVPDVEVWSDEWGGIIDTKAYARYDLPHDHQLRMHADYIPDYGGLVQGRPMSFFLYIAGGFAPSFNAKLRNVIDKSGLPGAGIAIQPLRQLIAGYPDSRVSHQELLNLWKLGREITSADVTKMLLG